MADFQFLRRVLGADAAACAAFGLAFSAGAAALAPALGYSEPFLFVVGLLLLASAALVGWTASRPVPPAGMVWLIIVGGAVFVAESLILLGQFGAALTPAGAALTATLAAAVTVFAMLEYVGLRRGGPVSA